MKSKSMTRLGSKGVPAGHKGDTKQMNVPETLFQNCSKGMAHKKDHF